MPKPAISADSHITETPTLYIDNIDPKFRDIAPRVMDDPVRGQVYVIDGMKDTIPMSLVAAAGKDPSTLSTRGAKFNDLHRGGWDPKAREADQDRDKVVAEIIYPSVGMVLCNHPDFAYKRACFDAYNRWLKDFCDGLPNRLYGMPQIVMETPESGIEEIRKAKDMGFRGVMMPGNPGHEDYHHKDYDRFWDAVVEMEMPVSFHILTSKNDNLRDYRGPKINAFQTIIRGNQDLIGTFIFGGVFERHPELKLVCVEADAGWAPHFMYRMDHAYKRHRFWMKCDELAQLPSEFFQQNVYMTFQDDWTAFQLRQHMNIERLLWANDFPHSDATWPRSQEMLAEHTADMTEWEKDRILHDNAVELYGLTIQ
tara:strand:- start:137 stop:1240 length:1104 start_codon:yes stop_codon:yes gene_type:complete